jgi:acetylornithine deacetylase
MDAVAILRALVGFDTTSRLSNLPLIEWVEAYLAPHGVRGRRLPDATGQKATLWVTIGPAYVPGYILSGHTDVVPVDGQDWASDPFVLTERDGRLYGRGACDMKGFVACALARVPAMVAAPMKKPIHLALSYDEEVGCVGVCDLVDELAAAPLKPAACFVGEPSGMQVVLGHKQKRSLRAVVRGRACHSSLAPQGVNAVDYAALLAVKVREIGQRLAQGPSDPLYETPVSTAHTGTLHGGTALNIVPDHAEMVFEFRVLPDQDIETLVEEVKAHARDVLEPQMQAVDPATGIDLTVFAGFPGLDTAADAPVATLAKRLAGRNDHAKVAYGAEAGRFAKAGIPSVIVGPGDIARAHRPDEFITRDELAACEAFIDRLIAEACA